MKITCATFAFGEPLLDGLGGLGKQKWKNKHQSGWIKHAPGAFHI